MGAKKGIVCAVCLLLERMMHVALLIGSLVLGFAVARSALLSKAWSKRVRVLGHFALVLLLFSMGLSLGANSELTSRLPGLGLKALILSLGTILGSLFMVWFVTRVGRPSK